MNKVFFAVLVLQFIVILACITRQSRHFARSARRGEKEKIFLRNFFSSSLVSRFALVSLFAQNTVPPGQAHKTPVIQAIAIHFKLLKLRDSLTPNFIHMTNSTQILSTYCHEMMKCCLLCKICTSSHSATYDCGWQLQQSYQVSNDQRNVIASCPLEVDFLLNYFLFSNKYDLL